MVVGLDLHELIEIVLLEAVGVGLRVDGEDVGPEAGDDRRIVLVRRERILRTLLVGVLDHPEKGIFFLLSVDDEFGTENLVTAMLGVDLAEHHELRVGRVAPGLLKALGEILHLLFGNGEPDLLVGFADGVYALGENVVSAAGTRFVHVEKVAEIGVNALGHLVVERGEAFPAERRGHAEADSALDALDGLKSAIAENIGRFRAPRGNRTLARGHVEIGAVAEPFRVEQRRCALKFTRIGAAIRLFNGVNPPGVDLDRPGPGVELGNRILERIKTERRIRIATDKQNHGVFSLKFIRILYHIRPVGNEAVF